MPRHYIPMDHQDGGHIAGARINYECLGCGAILPSKPESSLGCRCGNIFIDVPLARLSVKEDRQVRAFTM